MKRLAASALVVAALGATTAASDPAAYGHHGAPLTGLVVFPDRRFDPIVQQLMARDELRALPIGSSGVLYLYPVDQDPGLLEAQIRYLQQLLDRPRPVEPRAAQP